ncbi:MAG: hypothetical protein V8Q36_02840 [Anaerotignum sp.]
MPIDADHLGGNVLLLPAALNIHSNESWMFFVNEVVALVINFWTIAKTLFFQRESQWESNPLLKKLLYIPLALVVIYGVGVLLSSSICGHPHTALC